MCRFNAIPIKILARKKYPSKLFCGYQQTDSKVYTESQKTQNSQKIEDEQIQKTDTTQLQYLL